MSFVGVISMMSNIIEDKKQAIEIGVTIVLFAIAIIFDALMTVIIYMLYFIIFLEIVKAVINYIKEKDVEVRFLINAFIILSLREFIVNVVKINEEKISSLDMLFSNHINMNLFILAGVIVFLFFIRYLAIKTSVENMAIEK